MRIALVTTSFLPRIGGAEYAVHSLAREWAAQGHEVCVLNALTDRASVPDAPYEVRRYSLLRGGTRLGQHRFPFRGHAARQIGGFLEQYRPDFVSAHFGYPLAFWLTAIDPVPRFWITCHGPALNETPSGPRQRFGVSDELGRALNRAQKVVAISTHARSILHRIGVAPERVELIFNGVDTGRFARNVSFDFREALGLPRDAVVTLSVGREIWAKDYRTGITAFAEVGRRRRDAHYVILGKGTATWRQLAVELGVGDQVRFSEGLYDDELVAAYRQSDVFFLPSIKELCPLVVLEAMAAGLPSLVTDVSGSQDLVRSGHNGFVVPPGEVGPMSEALGRLVEHADVRRRFGEANLAASPQFDWSRIARLHLGEAAAGGGAFRIEGDPRSLGIR